MNPTELLKKIKRRLGTRALKLTLTDEDLLDIITGETLKTFSNYIPYVFTDFITPADLVPHTASTYYLDDCLERHHGVECIGIYDIRMSDGFSLVEAQMSDLSYGAPVDCVPKAGAYYNMSLENIALTGALSDITSMFEWARDIFKFEAPNKVTIARYKVSDFAQVKFQAVHSKDLTTVANTYEEEFFKLALLNIKIALYNEMKYYDQMETSFGQFQLRVDEWSNAESDRENLLSTWNEKYLINRQDTIFVI